MKGYKMNEVFKELVRVRLIETNYTVNAMSKKINVARDPIYRWLKGETTSIGSEVLGKVFYFLDVKVGLK